MADPTLLDAPKLSATYPKGGGTLQLRGEFTSVHPVQNPQFVQVPIPGGLKFEVRGVEAKPAVLKYQSPITDLNYQVTLPNKVFPSNTVVFVTKSSPATTVSIQYVDPSDQPSNLGLPTPPELLFLSWIEDATTAVKVNYPKTALIRANAQKVYESKKKSDLIFSADFRVQDKQMVTVTKDSDNISDPVPVPLGAVDVKDLKQVKINPWDVVAKSGIPNIQDYTAFSLFKYSSSTLPSGIPDQPYYEFLGSSKKRLALVGASDGKNYSV